MLLEIIQNGDVIDTRELSDGSYSIGRSSSCAIALKSPQVSKNHALLVIKGGKAAILDVGSANGVFVNGILIRKQRIDLGDDVIIGPFHLRLVSQINVPKRSAKIEMESVDDGNLARKLDMTPYPEAAPQVYRAADRFLRTVDDRLLVPFYAAIRKYDWRIMMGGIVGGALILAVVLSAWPFVNWGRSVLVTESTARGHAILRQCIRDNYRVLAKTNDFTRLTVEAADKEPGVIEAFIADPVSQTIHAPAKYYNKPVADLYALRAIEKIVKEEKIEASVERRDGTFVLAQPIFSYATDNTRSLVAIALLVFQLPDNIHSTFTPIAEMVLLAVFFGLFAYFLLMRMFSYPVTRLLDQVDSALKGEGTTISADIRFSEFETLAQNLNFAMSRIRSGVSQAPTASTSESDDEILQNSVMVIDNSMSDALLLLDTEKKVRFVGHVTEELLSMRSQYAVGQNISDACRDQSFSGTAIDMCDRVVQSLGEAQNSTLEINGISRNVSGVALRNRDAEIRYILITVRMNG